MREPPGESIDPDVRVSNRWTRCASTGKNRSFKRPEWVAWDIFPSGYLTLIPFVVSVTLLNGRVTLNMPVSIPVLSLVYSCVVDSVSMVSL